jgi:hypothetical protein
MGRRGDKISHKNTKTKETSKHRKYQKIKIKIINKNINK